MAAFGAAVAGVVLSASALHAASAVAVSNVSKNFMRSLFDMDFPQSPVFRVLSCVRRISLTRAIRRRRGLRPRRRVGLHHPGLQGSPQAARLSSEFQSLCRESFALLRAETAGPDQ